MYRLCLNIFSLNVSGKKRICLVSFASEKERVGYINNRLGQLKAMALPGFSLTEPSCVEL